MKRKISIHPEWLGQFPVWHNYQPGDFPKGHMLSGPLEPTDLPIDKVFINRLWKWSERWDSIFDQDFPPNSKFPTPEKEAEFWQEGAEIFRLLSEKLGDDYEIEPCREITEFREFPIKGSE